MCVGISSRGGETGRVFGAKGWMEGLRYQGTLKTLPDIGRPPLPAGVATGGHGGSQGNLGHEFISALLDNRPPMIDLYESLAMTVPGIIAHQSALKDGETLKIPQFDRPKAS